MIKKAKWFGLGLLALLVLVLITLVGVVYYLCTPDGLQYAVRSAQRYVPALRIEKAQGSLLEGVKLQGITYSEPGLLAQVNDVTLQLDLGALKHLDLEVPLVAVEGVKVAIDSSARPTTPPTESAPIENLKAPIAMRLHKLTVDNVDVAIDGHQVAFKHFETGASWANRQVTLFPTKLTQLAVSLAAPVADTPPAQTPDAQMRQEAKAVAQTVAVTLDGLQKKKGLTATLNKKVLPAPPQLVELLKTLKATQARFEKPLISGLPDLTLPVDIQIQGIQISQTRITGLQTPLGDIEVPLVALRGKVHGSLNELDEAVVVSNVATLDLRGQLLDDEMGTLGYQLKLNAPAATLAKLGIAQHHGLDVKMDVSGALLQSVQASLTVRDVVNAQANFVMSPAKPRTPLKLSLTTEDFTWPLEVDTTKTQQVKLNGQLQTRYEDYTRLRHTSLHWDGDLLTSQIAVSTDLDMVNNALNTKRRIAKPFHGHVSLTGQAGLAGIENLTAQIQMPQGKVAFTADLGWAQDLTLQTQLNVDDVITQSWLPMWPFHLNGQFLLKAQVDEQANWQASIAPMHLAGTIANAPIGIDGTLSANSLNNWQVNGVAIRLGKNTLSLEGSVRGLEQMDLAAKVDVPGLLNTIPGLKGMAQGWFKLTGSPLHPQLNANLVANDIGWQNQFGLHKLVLLSQAHNLSDASEKDVSLEKIEKSFENGEFGGQLHFEIQDLFAPSVKYQRMLIDAKGRESNHTVQVRFTGTPVTVELDFTGALDRHTLDWQAQLTHGLLKSQAGDWALEKKARLAFYRFKSQVLLGQQCWKSQFGQICIVNDAQLGQAGHLALEVRSLNTEIVKPFLRRKYRVKGTVSAKANVKWDLEKQKLPDATVNVNGDGLFFQTRYEGTPVPVTFERLHLGATVSNNKITASWDIQPQDNGVASGFVVLQDPENARRLSGIVGMRDINPSFVKPFLARGEAAKGRMNSKVRLSGTLTHPQLNGYLNVDDIDVDASFVPFDMQPSSMSLKFMGQKSELSGAVNTSSGVVSFNGHADWSGGLDAWKADIGVKSEGIKLLIPPMVQVDVNLDVLAKATPTLIGLSGVVNVPAAKVYVAQVPVSGVSVSSDEVLLNDQLQPIVPPSSPIQLRSNIALNIGDKVYVDALGLRAQLTGNLVIVQSNGRLGLNGQINMPLGRYRAYGQDLLVDKGTIFFNGPADNPGIQIEAIRNPDNTEDGVTAGIRVTGTAKNPVVSVFSNPTLSQEQALSYLLRGQGLDNEGQQSTSAAMTSLLIGLGASQGSSVLNSIGDTLGIKGLGVDTQGVGNSEQVVVSGYLLPGLQVKYGVGIFDSLATLTLRYRLLPKLYLQAVSGVDQALDVLYRFEF